MSLRKKQVMFGCMTEHFQLMPYASEKEGEHYCLTKNNSDHDVIALDNLTEMEELGSLLDKVISDVKKSVGLKDTRKASV